MRNSRKLDMASTDWLTTHFLAKSAYRFREIASLNIPSGARVIDLCCGPGLYMLRLLDIVGTKGHVTGIDIDPVSLDSAHTKLSTHPNKSWALHKESMTNLKFDLSSYDVVILFNSICYFDEPESVLRNIASKMKPGSQLIVKDCDLESFFFQPRETDAWASLIGAAKHQDRNNNPVSFTNFFGRKIHTLHRFYPFRDYKNGTWSQIMTYPFDEFESEYIFRNIECLVKQAGEKCNTKIIEYFKSEFYRPGGHFFSNPDAMLAEVEYLTTLTI